MARYTITLHRDEWITLDVEVKDQQKAEEIALEIIGSNEKAGIHEIGEYSVYFIEENKGE